jgi:RNA polymerase sigma-70 factor (ECF subfamily)
MRAPAALPGSGQFPVTRWTLIAATRGDPTGRRAALEELLGLYWMPLYCFVRRHGLDADAAQDAVQDFIARLLDRDAFARLDPARGRFRAYLRTALAHHLANRHEHATAQKRGGAAVTIPLDFDVAERRLDGAPLPAELAFEREWALAVMDRALARLRDEFDSGQRRGPFALVAAFFGAAQPPPSYDEAAAAHGMSATQLKAFLHRARVRYRELLREEVAPTLDDAAQIDDEIRALLQALSA